MNQYNLIFQYLKLSFSVSLFKALSFNDDLIEVYALLVSYLHFGFRHIINNRLANIFNLKIHSFEVLNDFECV